MRLLIFTEIGDKIGFGHVVRSSVLYDIFSDQGFDVEFILNGENREYSVIGSRTYRFLDWTNMERLKGININNNTISIIDSYIASKPIYNYISSNSFLSIFIDDNMRLEYPKGIVLNPTIYGKTFKYCNKNNVKYLIGEEYILLRKEFFLSKSIKINEEIKNILICLGGSNVYSEIKEILKTLKCLKKDYRVFIMANANFELDLNDENIEIYKNINIDKVIYLMRKCDIAISGGGQTLYELIKLGVPTIAYCIAGNQKRNINYLKKLGIISEIENLNTSLINTIKIYEDKNYRKNISERMLQIKIGDKIRDIPNWIGELN